MNSGTIRLVHLVKLINASNTIVGKHKRASLEQHLVGDRVLGHGSSETDTRGTFTGRVDAARGDTGNVLEKLGFGNSRVAHEANVEFATDLHSVARVLGDTADEHEQESLLDVFVAVNVGRDAAGEVVVEVGIVLEVDEALADLVGEDVLRVLLLHLLHVGSLEESVREEGCRAGGEASGVRSGQEDTRDLDNVAGADAASERFVEVDRHHARDVADGHLVGLEK